MSALWTSDAARAATGGRITAPWQATGVSIDSRSIERGDLFVALKDLRDGHEFVRAALEAGAAAALVTHVPEGVADDAPLLIVDDTLKALEALATARRAAISGKVIGITGSVGKTSTKEMIRLALSRQGKTHASVKSYNNHWGVPLTLARMPEDVDFAVIEMGMNAAGEIAALTRLARPHAALITEVAEAHMAGFKALKDVAKAKAEIFEGLEPDGAAILNRDTRTYPFLVRRARKYAADLVRFGMAGRPEFVLARTRLEPDATHVIARHGRERFVYKIGQPGAHFAMNSLGALGAIHAVGGDLALAALALADWQPPEGRGNRIEITPKGADAPILLIDESYNANPASMAAALASFAASTPPRKSGGRRIAIIGDMLELGAAAAQNHASIAADGALRSVDKIYTVGPLMAALHQALPEPQRGQHFAHADEALQAVDELARSGDAVMIKASLGTGLGKLVRALKSLGEETK